MFAFLFIMNSIIPITMIGFGLLWKNNPPKKINKLYGYRTNMSMKDDETWKFAHRYHGKVWYWSGIILLIFTIATMLILRYSYDDIEVISLLIMDWQPLFLDKFIPNRDLPFKHYLCCHS